MALDAQRADLAAAEPPPGTDPETTAAIAAAIDASFVDGFRLTMLIAAALTLAGAALAWWLVEGKPVSVDRPPNRRLDAAGS